MENTKITLHDLSWLFMANFNKTFCIISWTKWAEYEVWFVKFSGILFFNHGNSMGHKTMMFSSQNHRSGISAQITEIASRVLMSSTSIIGYWNIKMSQKISKTYGVCGYKEWTISPYYMSYSWIGSKRPEKRQFAASATIDRFPPTRTQPKSNTTFQYFFSSKILQLCFFFSCWNNTKPSKEFNQ